MFWREDSWAALDHLFAQGTMMAMAGSVRKRSLQIAGCFQATDMTT